MKKFKFILLFTSIFLLSFSACSDSDEQDLDTPKETTKDQSEEEKEQPEEKGYGYIILKVNNDTLRIEPDLKQMGVHSGTTGSSLSMIGTFKVTNNSNIIFNQPTVYFSISSKFSEGNYQLAGVDYFLGDEHKKKPLAKVDLAVFMTEDLINPMFYEIKRELFYSDKFIQVKIEDGKRHLFFKGELELTASHMRNEEIRPGYPASIILLEVHDIRDTPLFTTVQ